MLLPPDPPPPPEGVPTAPLQSRAEIQTGLLEKLVSSVADMRNDLHEYRAETAEELKGVRADLGLVSNDVGIIKDRVVLVEKRVDEVEKRADANSIRARQPSAVDLETQAELAKTIVEKKALAEQVAAIEQKTDAQTTKIESIEKKTDAQSVVLLRLDKVASNPTVKLLLHALAIGLISWLAGKGIHVGEVPAPAPAPVLPSRPAP